MQKYIDLFIISCCVNILTIAFIGWLGNLTVFTAIAAITFNQLLLISSFYSIYNKDVCRD